MNFEIYNPKIFAYFQKLERKWRAVQKESSCITMDEWIIMLAYEMIMSQNKKEFGHE